MTTETDCPSHTEARERLVEALPLPGLAGSMVAAMAERERRASPEDKESARADFKAVIRLADALPEIRRTLLATPTQGDISPSRELSPTIGSALDDVDAFLAEVRAELIRARAKFPGDRIMTIALAEEFGELCKAVLDEPAANVRKEAVQTAVMAARVVLDGDGSVIAWRAARGLDPLIQPEASNAAA